MNRSRFQLRYLALVDVLGFKGIVERMAADGRLFVTVRDALKTLARQSRTFRRYNATARAKYKATIRKGIAPMPVRKSELRMTAFSDCYVVSETFPAWHVLAAVQALGARFLKAGILTRGAVVYGRAYHRNDVLFGPAMNEAHQLESEVAKYPRILVTESVRAKVWGYNQGLCKGRLLNQDVDGCWFVNLLVPPLSNWAALSDAEASRDVREYLKDVRQSLLTQLEHVKGNAGHLSKVWWLVHKYNEAAKTESVELITP